MADKLLNQATLFRNNFEGELSTFPTKMARIVQQPTPAAGQSFTLASLTGAGVIKMIQFTLGRDGDAGYNNVLEIYVDGETTPSFSVDVGTLLLTHLGGHASAQAYGSKHMIAVPYGAAQNNAMSGGIFFPVPYGNGCIVKLRAPAGGTCTGAGYVFGQVAYCPGMTSNFRLRSANVPWLSKQTYGKSDQILFADIPNCKGVIAAHHIVAQGANGYYYLERCQWVSVDAECGNETFDNFGIAQTGYTSSGGEDLFLAGFQVHDAPGSQGGGWLDTAKDVAQSAATGIEKGAIGMATALPAAERFARGLADRFIFDPVLSRTVGLPPKANTDASQQPPEVSDYLSVAGAEKAADALGQPFYKPQTTAGRYAQTVGEFVPGATRSGILGLLKYGVAPGLASEAAGEATQGTALEPYARVGAALATGGAAALVSRPGTAASALAEAAGPLDAATLGQAQDLMDAARQQGSPLTLAEAVQQVTNSGTRLGAVQRVVEQSRGGADTMAKFYADRPNQVQQAGTAAIDRIGVVPAVPLDGSVGPVYPNTSAIGPGVQRAAQGAVDATPQAQNARQALTDAGPRVTPEQAGQVIQPALRGAYDERLAARSAQARQDYAAAGSDTIDPDGVQGILDDLDKQAAADKTGLLAGRLRDLRNRLSVQAKPQGAQWEADPLGSGVAPTAPDMPSPPPEAYMDAPAVAPRPDVPRPQTLQQFVKAAGGVRDPGGDLAAMGLDQVPGLVAKPGKGLSPDAMRQAAAQSGFLGPHIDDAMANTTIGDLHDALASERPVHSVYDSDAVDAWNAHDLSRSEAAQLGRPTGRSAMPGRTPLSAYGDEMGGAAAAEPDRVPITDIANLNRARKVYRDRIALPANAPKALDKETAATIGPVLGDLDRVMTEGSPAYARANENFARNSEPLQPFQNTPGIARSHRAANDRHPPPGAA